MGKRGSLPEDAQTRWLRGTAKRPASSVESESKPVAPRMPGFLPPDAQAAWREIIPKLLAMKIPLQPLDRTALADMAVCVARLQEAERDISARGQLVPGDRGLVKNPSCQLARQYREGLLRWSQRFGLTPGDRDRIEIPKPEPEDPLLRMMSELRETASEPDDPEELEEDDSGAEE